MNTNGGTLLGMPGKRKQGQANKPNRRPAVTVYARIDPEIGSALNQYLASADPEPSVTAVVESSLKLFLAKHGFWPPTTHH